MILLIVAVKSVFRRCSKPVEGEGIKIIVVFRLCKRECMKRKKLKSNKGTSCLDAKFRLIEGKSPFLMCNVPSHVKRMP